MKELADYDVFTKSALMLGLGESKDALFRPLRDLREHNVDFVTMGQYMRPSKRHLAIKEFVEPEVFDELKTIAYDEGFIGVASSPLVRASYRVGDLFDEAMAKLSKGGVILRKQIQLKALHLFVACLSAPRKAISPISRFLFWICQPLLKKESEKLS